jgi:hypothetical protein
MRPMVVNTKQRIAVLASGLAIATTGFVTDAQASAPGDSRADSGDQSGSVTVVADSAPRRDA